MTLSLTNRDDIVASSFSIIAASGAVVDVLDTVQWSIVELSPASLNNLFQLSADFAKDPNCFRTIQTSVNSKAVSSATFNKIAVDAALAMKSDISITYTKTQINAILAALADENTSINFKTK